jgi:predicted glutamine amidotransferase
MCRILGVVARDSTDFVEILRDAPRSLATLSHEHPHGWGIGVSDEPSRWRVTKRAARAHDDPGFHDASRTSRGRVLLAHIRKRTIGSTSIHNTHPFQRGRWLFAHNGTISDTRFLVRNTSKERAREATGDTDSEQLLAYLLTRFDAAGVTEHDATDATDAAVLGAVRGALAEPDFGACNFLLSDGHALYAHRWGRTLFVLERPEQAVLVASEAMTEEPWRELPEAALLRLDGGARPGWRVLG